MASDGPAASKYSPRVIWATAGAAALVMLTIVALRPWNGSAVNTNPPSENGQTAATVTVTIPVEGMSCVVCASSVKRTVQEIDGVSEAEVGLAGRRAKVSYIEGTTSPEEIAAAIARLGYKTGPPVIDKGQ